MFNTNKIDRLHKRNIELARQVRDLNEENKIVHNENKELRFENEELMEVLKRINKLTECN